MKFSYQRVNVILFSILLLLAACYFHSERNICTEPTSTYNNYTYIVVGAGTSGCVLAARLSENRNNTVLLIEAGVEFNILSKVPLFSPLLHGSSYDWSFSSEPQKWSSKGMIGNQQKVPRGKGLGGSAQINFMVHGYLEPKDLETWKVMGAEGLKKNVAVYYNRLFNAIPNDTTEDKQFNHLSKTERHNYHYYIEEMKWKLTTILEMAVSQSDVPNLKFCKGFSTIRDGNRWTTFDSYLKPALKRQNLQLLCNTEVTKVLIKNKEVYGVESISRGLRKHYYANKVILSTGSISTPKLLLLSGIGDSELLQKLDISVVQDVIGVGENLHDHLNMPIYVTVEKPISLTMNKLLSFKEIYDYIFHKSGSWGKSPIAGIAYSPSNFSITLFGLGSTDERVFRVMGNYKTQIFQEMFPFHKDFSKEGFVFLATCAQPRSRGYVKLRSNNYSDPPVIDPKYLENEADVECTRNALKVVDKLIQTKIFEENGAKIHWPNIKECKNWDKVKQRDNYFECIIRYAAMTGYHPAGTCKMGHNDDPYAVVDEQFRVKNMKGLWIIDASILPTPVSTFPNSIMVTIAEYASKILSSMDRISTNSI